MTDWYYHDPIEGRVGPLPADQLRARYRERRIQRDTLVWHAGLREWSALDQQADALDLDSITPDTSLPPPLPRALPSLSSTPTGGSAGSGARPPKTGMSGCLIAVLVAVALSVPVAGILAAIAIPAYNDYVKRSKAARSAAPAVFDADRFADADATVQRLLTSAMATYYVKNGGCPDTFEFESVQVRNPDLAGRFEVTPTASAARGCSYVVTFAGHGAEVDGMPVRYDLTIVQDEVALTCDASALPAGFGPPDCR